MRQHQLWCAAALIVTLGIAGVSAGLKNAENAPNNVESKGRYLRKVLVSRSLVTTAVPSVAPAAPTVTPAAVSEPSSPPTDAPLVPEADDDDAVANARATRSAAIALQQQWLSLLSDYNNNGATSGFNVASDVPEWITKPFQLDLSAYGGNGRSNRIIPVFVLPVPIPVKQECSADPDRRTHPNRWLTPSYPRLIHPIDNEPRHPYDDSSYPFLPPYSHPFHFGNMKQPETPPKYPPAPRLIPPSVNDPRHPYDDNYYPFPPSSDHPHHFGEMKKPDSPLVKLPPRLINPSDNEPRHPKDDSYKPSPSIHPGAMKQPQTPSNKIPKDSEENVNDKKRSKRLSYPNLHTGKPEDSFYLVELFRNQKAQDFNLPPVRPYHWSDPEHPPLPQIKPVSPAPGPPPPQPVFDRPLAVRGSLIVLRAGYKDYYTAWWDPATGNHRIDFHDGETSIYKTIEGDQVKWVAKSYDRTGDRDLRVCIIMSKQVAGSAGRALPPPFLPDMELFSFQEFVDLEGTMAEKWKYSMRGEPGEYGAAGGEVLTFYHELLLARCDDFVKPIWYQVLVDSSVLGPESDAYAHHYAEVSDHQLPPELFQFELASNCDMLRQTNDMLLVEPLNEFTREPRVSLYDRKFDEFKKRFNRDYADSVEEAVRKNLFKQTSRFVSAGNRQAATFKMGETGLGDRLGAETALLAGARAAPRRPVAEPFPYSDQEVRHISANLTKHFDWRWHGVRTPVKNQGNCSSCWAFAAAGAVEGALARATGALVPLSHQHLIDCTSALGGGSGCEPRRPTDAFDYIKSHGIAAEEDYKYLGVAGECRDTKVVTKISGYVEFGPSDINKLKVAIAKEGPVMVIVASQALSFKNYRRGWYRDLRCSESMVDHAMLAVGWRSKRNTTYFVLKNSWGVEEWGEFGYVSLHGPSNTCGVLRAPVLPRLAGTDRLLPAAAATARLHASPPPPPATTAKPKSNRPLAGILQALLGLKPNPPPPRM